MCLSWADQKEDQQPGSSGPATIDHGSDVLCRYQSSELQFSAPLPGRMLIAATLLDQHASSHNKRCRSHIQTPVA